MNYIVTKGSGPGKTIVKDKLSKSQAESFCKKENDKFFEQQRKIREDQIGTGKKLQKDKYVLYKIEKC